MKQQQQRRRRKKKETIKKNLMASEEYFVSLSNTHSKWWEWNGMGAELVSCVVVVVVLCKVHKVWMCEWV